MKLPKIALHYQILFALIAGALFGAIFKIDQNKIIINLLSDNQVSIQIIDNWESVSIKSVNNVDYVIAHFDNINSNSLVKFFSNRTDKNKLKLEFEISKEQIITVENINSISKEKTIAIRLKPIGDLFIRLLSFLAIPLVLSSLIVGASSLEDFKKLGRIGTKTFALYLATTAIAITIGLTIANLIAPGEKIETDTKNRLIAAYSDETSDKIISNLDVDIVDFIVNIVPRNPFHALANGNMLQIVFFAVFFGLMLTFIKRESAEPVIGFFKGVSELMIKMVDFIMVIAPYGVFALIASTVADFGFEILSTLIWYILAVILGLAIQTLLIYPGMLKMFTKRRIKDFFLGIRDAQIIAFSTSSSAATLPVTMECLEENLKVPKKITGFVLPLGATINMDGTALYQGVAAVFIAQVYGIDLSLTDQLTIVFTAVLASIGTAPVPGVGIIMLVMILQAVHIPPEGIALILGVDRILDMARTISNISGDAAVTLSVAEGEI